MSHISIIVLSTINDANKWANFFDSVVDVFYLAPAIVQSELLSVKNSPGFCCAPTWQDFDGALYDSLGLQSEKNREYWVVSDTMIDKMNYKEHPFDANTLYFSPVLHYPDRVEYAFNNMLSEYQTLDDLTPDQLAQLAALGNDYYIQMMASLWDSFSQDTKDFLFTQLGTPTQIIES